MAMVIGCTAGDEGLAVRGEGRGAEDEDVVASGALDCSQLVVVVAGAGLESVRSRARENSRTSNQLLPATISAARRITTLSANT